MKYIIDLVTVLIKFSVKILFFFEGGDVVTNGSNYRCRFVTELIA